MASADDTACASRLYHLRLPCHMPTKGPWAHDDSTCCVCCGTGDLKTPGLIGLDPNRLLVIRIGSLKKTCSSHWTPKTSSHWMMTMEKQNVHQAWLGNWGIQRYRWPALSAQNKQSGWLSRGCYWVARFSLVKLHIELIPLASVMKFNIGIAARGTSVRSVRFDDGTLCLQSTNFFRHLRGRVCPEMRIAQGVALCNAHLWADPGRVIDGHRHSTENRTAELWWPGGIPKALSGVMPPLKSFSTSPDSWRPALTSNNNQDRTLLHTAVAEWLTCFIELHRLHGSPKSWVCLALSARSFGWHVSWQAQMIQPVHPGCIICACHATCQPKDLEPTTTQHVAYVAVRAIWKLQDWSDLTQTGCWWFGSVH